ncbi:DotH/IcmK family type IV secretion protein [Stutzerimonas stutzeri]|uniref:DotH/IcmK family type IV secretion protein n=1 Tax=Stutzerimonas stutzeri TaxID=316 RepID=UPI00244B494D|nr:DotH/IcmK family type IV secretion protein [Stutzerimonas stutzeri]MDH0609784.1 DotH/IcmK family type IV secretion protein [Stutzerimonas stutzeri]
MRKVTLIPSILLLSLLSIQAAAEPAEQDVRSSDPLVDTLLKRKYPLTIEQQAVIEQYMIDDRKGLAPQIPLGATSTDPEQIIDLTDGGKTKSVTLQLGYLTSLMVVGENGAPWPVRRARAGDDSVVNVDLVEDSGAVEMHPQKPWVNTNVILYLVDRNEPIKLYVKVSSDPSDGVKDSLKLIVDGVPTGSAPLLQPNRVAIDHQLMNALGQSPGRNWTSLKVTDTESVPFSISYWLSPNREDAIIRLRGASMVGPDWLTETRDVDGVTRVYRYRAPIPLMIRTRDSAGIEYQVHLENPADILAGRDGSRTMTVKRTSPERPPMDSALPFEEPLGLVGRDRVQRIAPASNGAQESVKTYESFDGKGVRTNRVQIVSDLTINRDTAARLIEETHRNRPIPVPAANAEKASDVQVSAVAAEKPLVAKTVSTAGTTTAATAATTVLPSVVATAPPASSGVMFSVRNGGLYENLFRLTQEAKWNTPIWDLGEQDKVVQGGYVINAPTPEEAIAKFLEPYADSYRFNVQISPLEKKVWLH